MNGYRSSQTLHRESGATPEQSAAQQGARESPSAQIERKADQVFRLGSAKGGACGATSSQPRESQPAAPPSPAQCRAAAQSWSAAATHPDTAGERILSRSGGHTETQSRAQP